MGFSRRDRPDTYPIIPWIILNFIQGAGSLTALVLWPVVFSHLGTGKLEQTFAKTEGTDKPDEMHTKWYFKVFHGAAIFSFLCVILVNVLRFYRRLHPAVSAALSSVCLLLYITGIAGVGSFTFGNQLSGPCGGDVSCQLYKAGFFSGHIAGYCYILHLILDGYAWGRRDSASPYVRSQKISSSIGDDDSSTLELAYTPTSGSKNNGAKKLFAGLGIGGGKKPGFSSSSPGKKFVRSEVYEPHRQRGPNYS